MDISSFSSVNNEQRIRSFRTGLTPCMASIWTSRSNKTDFWGILNFCIRKKLPFHISCSELTSSKEKSVQKPFQSKSDKRPLHLELFGAFIVNRTSTLLTLIPTVRQRLRYVCKIQRHTSDCCTVPSQMKSDSIEGCREYHENTRTCD